MSSILDTYPMARFAYEQFKGVVFADKPIPTPVDDYFEKLAEVVQACLNTRTISEQDEILTLAILRKKILSPQAQERGNAQDIDDSIIVTALANDYSPVIAEAIRILLRNGEDALAATYPRFALIEQLEETAALAAISDAYAKTYTLNWQAVLSFAQDELNDAQEKYGSESEQSRLAKLYVATAQRLYTLCTPPALPSGKTPPSPRNS